MKGGTLHRHAAAVHAMRRFRQRCGVELPLEEYRRMCRVIAGGSAPPVALTPDGIRIFHVRYGGVSAYAVHSHDVGGIATFYPALSWVIERGGKVLSA